MPNDPKDGFSSDHILSQHQRLNEMDFTRVEEEGGYETESTEERDREEESKTVFYNDDNFCCTNDSNSD